LIAVVIRNVTANKHSSAGFDAYRYTVLRVPGLWWAVPVFYLPIVSCFVGRRVYDWIANHRGHISEKSVRSERTQASNWW